MKSPSQVGGEPLSGSPPNPLSRLFGAAKIPELARSLGKAKGEFEKGARESRDERKTETEDERVRRAAKELGIPTEERPLSDIKADLRSKMA